jgi:uncharacterized membrane protein
MTTTAPRRTRTAPDRPVDRTGSGLFSALIGLAAAAVLLQGVWAGIFLEHDGQRDASESWINVHATGGEVAIVLSALAAAAAIWKLRERRELWIGSIVLVVLLILESYLGGLIKDQGKDSLTAVHIPLAMAIMGLVVWLPFRAASARRGLSTDR